MHQRLDLGAERVLFAWWRGGGREVRVEFLLRDVGDVGVQVGEVLGGEEIDFAVVGVHCLLWRGGCWCVIMGSVGERLGGLGDEHVAGKNGKSDRSCEDSDCESIGLLV